MVLMDFFQILSHICQPAENGAPHRAFVYALGLGDLPVGHAEDKVSIHPAALDLRQTVQRVPQKEKPLFHFQHFLGRELMQTGGILDTVVAVQRVLRLVVVTRRR